MRSLQRTVPCWRVGILGPASVPGDTLYRFLAAGDRVGVFIADAPADEAAADVFASELGALRDPVAAFDSMNRWLLRAEIPALPVRALFAAFDPTGTIRVAWAGHHGIYVIRADGALDAERCPSVALGLVPGVSARETTIEVGRGEVMFVPNAALERLCRMGAVRPRALAAGTALDGKIVAASGPGGIPSALKAWRVGPRRRPAEALSQMAIGARPRPPRIACAF